MSLNLVGKQIDVIDAMMLYSDKIDSLIFENFFDIYTSELF